MASSSTFLAREVYGQVGAGGRGGLPLLDRLLDLLLDVFEVDVEVGEHRGGHAFALTDEAEQDVLGTDVLVVETGRLFAGHLQDLPDTISKVVAVHRGTLRCSEGRRRGSSAASHFGFQHFSHEPCPPERQVGIVGSHAFRHAPGAPAACRSAAC